MFAAFEVGKVSGRSVGLHSHHPLVVWTRSELVEGGKKPANQKRRITAGRERAVTETAVCPVPLAVPDRRSTQAFRCRGSSRGARGGCRGPRPTSRIRRPRSRPFLGERDSTPTRRACSAPARTGLAAAGNAGGANGWKSSAYENTCEAPSECVTGGPWSSWFRRRNQGADMGSPEARGADATPPRVVKASRQSSRRGASRRRVAAR